MAAGTTALSAAVQASWSAELERRQQAREISRHEMYFLHRTEELLDFRTQGLIVDEAPRVKESRGRSNTP